MSSALSVAQRDEGAALWEPHNSTGMYGMSYLNCFLTRRLEFSLISINTQRKGMQMFISPREAKKSLPEEGAEIISFSGVKLSY